MNKRGRKGWPELPATGSTQGLIGTRSHELTEGHTCSTCLSRPGVKGDATVQFMHDWNFADQAQAGEDMDKARLMADGMD